MAVAMENCRDVAKTVPLLDAMIAKRQMQATLVSLDDQTAANS